MLLREQYLDLPSTQERAIELARTGVPVGTRVVASRQTAGRGRSSHRWESPSGGLYLSIVLPDAVEPNPLLSVVLGGYLADALDRHYAVKTSVKWPNDVGVEAEPSSFRKLAGILVDRVQATGGQHQTVAGFGVNVSTVRTDLSPELGAQVAILAELLPVAPSLRTVEDHVAECALRVGEMLSSPAGKLQLLESTRRRLFGVGREVAVDGRRVGHLRGLADDGSLRVETDAGDRVFHTGQLAMVRA